MESTYPLRGKDSGPMARRIIDVEAEKALGASLAEAAKKIETSESQQDRISNTAEYLEYMRQYMLMHRIDLASQVNPVRAKKQKKKERSLKDKLEY